MAAERGLAADAGRLRRADAGLDGLPAGARLRQRAEAAGFRKQRRHDRHPGRGGRRGPRLPPPVQADRPVLLAGARGGRCRRRRAGAWSRTPAADGARSSPLRSRCALRNVDVVAALVNRGHIVVAGGGGGIPVVVPEEGEVAGSRGRHRQGLRGVHARRVSFRGSLHHPDGRRPSRRATSGSRPRLRFREIDVATARALLAAGPVSPGQHGARRSTRRFDSSRPAAGRF